MEKYNLDEWFQLTPSEFREKSELLLKLSDAIEKLDSEINQKQKRIQKYVETLKSLKFTNEGEKSIQSAIQNYDKFTQSAKDLSNAQEKLKETQEAVGKQSKAQEGSLEALKNEAKQAQKAYEALGSSVDDSIKESTLRKFKESQKALEKQRKAINDTRKEAREFAKDNKVAEGSLDDMRKKLRDLVNQRNTIRVDSDDFKKAQIQVRTLNDEIKRLESQAGDNRRNVGNYAASIKEAFSGIQAASGGAISGITSGGGGLGALSGAIGSVPQLAAAVAVVESLSVALQELGRVNRSVLEIQQLSKTAGAELKQISADVLAVSNTFKLGEKEVAEAANSLAKQYNITFGQALTQLEKQLLAAGSQSDVVLDLIREYPIQFKNAGISIEDYTKIISQAALQGDFFADKTADAVKEINLRLSEFTPSVQKALEGAFGNDFAAKIKQRVNSGTEPILNIFRDIGKEARQAGLSTTQLATLTADLGGGPAEDAGGLLRVYELINDALKDGQRETSELEKRQAETLRIQKEYNAQLVNLSENFSGLGTTIENNFTSALTEALSVLNSLLTGFSTVQDLVVSLDQKTENYRKTVKSFSGQDRAKEFSRLTKELREQEKALDNLTQTSGLDNFGREVQEALLDAASLGLPLDAVLDTFGITKDQVKDSILGDDATQAIQKQAARVKALKDQLSILGEADVSNIVTGSPSPTPDPKSSGSSKKEKEYLTRVKLLEELKRVQAELNQEIQKEAELQRPEKIEELANERARLADLLGEELLKRKEILQANALGIEVETLKKAEIEKTKIVKAEGVKRLKFFENEQEAQQVIIQEASAIISSVMSDRYQSEKQAAQRAFDFKQRLLENELERAGDNEFVRAEIQERITENERRFAEEQAKREKRQAVFQNTLYALTALGLAAAQAFLNPAANFAAAQAAFNAAFTAAKPIPAFEKGTESTPKGPVVLAEKGPELMEKNGKFMMADKPGIYEPGQGWKIYTSPETQAFLGHNNTLTKEDIPKNTTNGMFSELLRSNEKLNETLKNKSLTFSGTIFTRKGIQRVENLSKKQAQWLQKNR